MSLNQRILLLTSWPERFDELPLATELATSIADALAKAEVGQYLAIFVDAVLPGNQSGYRFLRELRRLGLSTGPVFIMADQITLSDSQLVCERGATGLIAKDARSVMKALQKMAGQAEAARPPAQEPRWLPAVVHAARQFLASEAERVVREHLTGLRASLGGEVSATALIQAIGGVLDDEDDRMAFAREATQAIRTYA